MKYKYCKNIEEIENYAAVPASNLEFMNYDDWKFIKSVIVPGCYLSILCTRIR